MHTIQQQVKSLIGRLLHIDAQQIPQHAHLRHDLGADSLDLVELILLLAQHFDVDDIRDEEVRNIRTVGDIATYLEMKVAT